MGECGTLTAEAAAFHLDNGHTYQVDLLAGPSTSDIKKLINDGVDCKTNHYPYLLHWAVTSNVPSKSEPAVAAAILLSETLPCSAAGAALQLLALQRANDCQLSVLLWRSVFYLAFARPRRLAHLRHCGMCSSAVQSQGPQATW